MSELLDEMERYHIKLQSRNAEKIKKLHLCDATWQLLKILNND